ncbi:MAG: hypothetical protein WC979_01590 [Candidatus Pacearchaeota archaeon]|jgi:hypothetical protein
MAKKKKIEISRKDKWRIFCLDCKQWFRENKIWQIYQFIKNNF